ncbi:MAG: hypothetical protein ACLQU3_06435 [Limisphaerales bacterium]
MKQLELAARDPFLVPAGDFARPGLVDAGFVQRSVEASRSHRSGRSPPNLTPFPPLEERARLGCDLSADRESCMRICLSGHACNTVALFGCVDDHPCSTYRSEEPQ